MTKAAGVALSVLAGVGAALQARINGELGRRLDDGIAAATISFSVGLILLLFAIPFIRNELRSVRQALRDRTLLWWQCLGGAFGAFLVVTQGLTVATLGVAVFTVAVVAGQSASSLAVDRMGFVPGGTRAITRTRALGALLCVIAVVIAVSDRLGDAKALGLAALPALAGIGIAWQQGVNGLVRQAAGSVWPPTLINFTVGTSLLFIMLATEVALRGAPKPLPREPWLYTGGLFGIVFIAIAAAVVARVGVLLMGLGMIAGQILGSLAIDIIAPAAERPDLRTFVGAALALVAVAFAARPPRARPSAPA